MKQAIQILQNTPKNDWELINEKQVIYLCYDCEFNPCFISNDIKIVNQYCKDNFCKFSEYPIGTYISSYY